MSRVPFQQHLFIALRFVAAVALLGWSGSVAYAASTSFSGRATVIQASAPVVGTVVLADTGPLPATGGEQEASLLSAGVPGLLSAEVLHATTVGQADRSRSEASVAALTVTAGGHTITADFLMSRATAMCGSKGATSSGNSQVANLMIDNQAISVTGQPNQTIVLPTGAGTIVINEQQSPRNGDITVSALHVSLNTMAGNTDVVVASAHADITCPPPGQITCTGGDFVTGGGWISPSNAGRDNFAVAGGIKQGAFWGHLEYVDHATGMRVKGTGVTAYSVGATATTRHIEGTAEIDGTAGTYAVDVADNGEPGRSDTFHLTLSNGYTAAGALSGGNIQLHTPCK